MTYFTNPAKAEVDQPVPPWQSASVECVMPTAPARCKPEIPLFARRGVLAVAVSPNYPEGCHHGYGGGRMEDSASESNDATLRVDFDRPLKLGFHRSHITSNAGLLACGGRDDALALTDLAGAVLSDGRRARNTRHLLFGNPCSAASPVARVAIIPRAGRDRPFIRNASLNILSILTYS
jgi:hypothetical protein